MLFDIIDWYNKEKINILVELWTKIIQNLAIKNDTKKIMSFLNKCWIIWIDEKEKKIHLWIPNEFILSQVKKFFQKPLNESVQEIYNPYFKISFHVYPKFQTWHCELQVDLKKIFWIKESKETKLDIKTTEKLKEFFWVLFDPKYRFDNFIAGSSSELAFSAAKAVSWKPGIVYNPFFIHGNVWLWKTHLLQSIWNYIIENNKDKVVVYLPTTKLIDEIVDAIKKNKMQNLMQKFEEVDVLILDDIQFLKEKEKTQEIFHNIFNDFQMKKKQIVLSSDRPPRELTLLEPRLRSRFALWLVVDIKKPDFETRIAILESKLKEKWEKLDPWYIDLIAQFVKDNIRELEWALNFILSKKVLLWKELDENDINEALNTLWYDTQTTNQIENKIQQIQNKNQRKNEDFNKIVEYVSWYYNISVYDIKWDSRKKEVSLARQMLMYFAKKYFGWTLEKIWDFLWWKNHATVIYSINNFEKLLKHNKQLHTDFHIIIEEIGL